jgi:hypothetical protein
MIDGTKISALEGWSAAAVSAAVSQRFLDIQGTDPADITSVLEAYNDIVMTQNIGRLDAEIAAGGDDVDKLKAKRAGALKNIQDQKIKEMIPAAPA